MKVRLLNDGGFADLKKFKFPMVVNGVREGGTGNLLKIHDSEFGIVTKNNDDDYFLFSINGECEVISENV